MYHAGDRLTTMPKRRSADPRRQPEPGGDVQSAPRIIGGSLRGRRLAYSGQQRTRPMKDRLREAVFNRLGPAVRGTHALDLFAGTGALGIEAVSRGAARATLVERHFPTADLVRRSVEALGIGGVCQVVAADSILWARRLPELGPQPWLVFVSPPYALFVERRDEMLRLIDELMRAAPPGSMLVVEADERLDPRSLPCAGQWDVREMPPARVGIWRKAES